MTDSSMTRKRFLQILFGAAASPSVVRAAVDPRECRSDRSLDPSYRPKILVVDDKDSVRESLAMVLRRMEYRCTLASNLEQAKTAFCQSEFDVVLTDLQMPRGNEGVELCQFVNRRPDPPAVLIMSGSTTPETLRDAFHAGAVDYLDKPFRRERLIEAVEFALGAEPVFQHPRAAGVILSSDKG